MKKKTLLLAIILTLLICITACHKVSKREKTMNGLNVEVLNETDYTYKAINLTYVDEDGNMKALVSNRKRMGETASFQVEYTDKFNFTINCVSEEIKVNSYNFEVNNQESNLVLYIKKSDDGSIVVSITQ